jgi:hypothetical protein
MTEVDGLQSWLVDGMVNGRTVAHTCNLISQLQDIPDAYQRCSAPAGLLALTFEQTSSPLRLLGP